MTELINNHKNYFELGYRLQRKYWGRGIAFESAEASLNYAFDQLKIREIFAIADCENIGSNKILRKLGMDLINTFNHQDISHNWYCILNNRK